MLAEVTFSTEGIVVIGTLLAALTGAVSYLFLMLTANRDREIARLQELHDRQIEILKSDKKSWQEMAQELGINIEKVVNRKRASEGLPPFRIMEPIVPEHSSPVTVQQQSTADIGTMRARVVAAFKELDFPPRPTPPPADLESANESLKSAMAHEETKKELTNATVVDAISDAKGAVDIAKVAIGEASDAVQENKKSVKPEERQP